MRNVYALSQLPEWAMNILDAAFPATARLTGTISARYVHGPIDSEGFAPVIGVELWSTTGHNVTPAMLN